MSIYKYYPLRLKHKMALREAETLKLAHTEREKRFPIETGVQEMINVMPKRDARSWGEVAPNLCSLSSKVKLVSGERNLCCPFRLVLRASVHKQNTPVVVVRTHAELVYRPEGFHESPCIASHLNHWVNKVSTMALALELDPTLWYE